AWRRVRFAVRDQRPNASTSFRAPSRDGDGPGGGEAAAPVVPVERSRVRRRGERAERADARRALGRECPPRTAERRNRVERESAAPKRGGRTDHRERSRRGRAARRERRNEAARQRAAKSAVAAERAAS